MFEKEAEEYLKTDGTKAEQIFNMLNEISPLKITSTQATFIIAMIKQVYQDGAEFGYNKANEWHKVADGDLPKEDNKIVICICGDGFINGKRHYKLKLLTRGEFKLFLPYAWKEIVLPKELAE